MDGPDPELLIYVADALSTSIRYLWLGLKQLIAKHIKLFMFLFLGFRP